MSLQFFLFIRKKYDNVLQGCFTKVGICGNL